MCLLQKLVYVVQVYTTMVALRVLIVGLFHRFGLNNNILFHSLLACFFLLLLQYANNVSCDDLHVCIEIIAGRYVGCYSSSVPNLVFLICCTNS